jgi:hypothetical protein
MQEIATTVQFAMDELANLFGNSIRKDFITVAASSWSADPWACGAFAYAPPGRAGERSRLAQAVDIFAGEACHPHFFLNCSWCAVERLQRSRRYIGASNQRRPELT